MSEISSSPDRNTFQRDCYIKQCEEDLSDPVQGMMEMFERDIQRSRDKTLDPDWKIDNMEYDLRTSQVMLDKVRSRDEYAQHVYAALCNNEFQKRDVFPILTDKRWSCSWRYAGGIVADMQGTGDYIDWYCSGIRYDESEIDTSKFTPEQLERYEVTKLYVPECHVTDEVREDLYNLGWLVIDSEE